MSKKKSAKTPSRKLLVIPVVAIIGTIALLTVSAASRRVAVEPENSSGSQNTISDPNASGGKAFRFTRPISNAPDLSSLDNLPGLFQYHDFENHTAAQRDALGTGPYGAFHNSNFTNRAQAFTRVDENGHGNFRIICTPSHFAYDDPIVFPDQPGRAHLHMFWGNTKVDAFTTADKTNPSDNLLERGGSTCQGGALNRSSYWAPAMFAGGAGPGRKIVMPKEILLYYKSQRPQDVDILPLGIQLLVGNVNPGGKPNSSFTLAPRSGEPLSWGCNNGSQAFPPPGMTNFPTTIPGTNGTPQCKAGEPIQATIQFPQCIAKNPDGSVMLTHPDFISHTHMLLTSNGYGNQTAKCPASHPYRVPQITYLIKWENPPGLQEASWRLSSDLDFDKPTGQVPHPGGSLHGDWLGGWHDGTIQAWTDGCFRTIHTTGKGRDCTLGATGENLTYDRATGTSLSLNKLPGTQMDRFMFNYVGPQLIDDPFPSYIPR